MSRLAITSRGVFSRDVVLDIAGIRRGRTVILWENLDHYRYDWQDWSRPGDIIAVGAARKTIRIAPFAAQWLEAAEYFLVQAHARLRADPYFEPFALENAALVFGGRRLAIEEIRHVELASVGRDVIVVVHTREGGEWASCDVLQIASFWLFIDMLVEAGVTIRSTLPLHAPPVMAHVAEMVALDERLPRARIS